MSEFENDDIWILDGDESEDTGNVGIESTVVKVVMGDLVEVLRPGKVTRGEVGECLREGGVEGVEVRGYVGREVVVLGEDEEVRSGEGEPKREATASLF